MTTMTNRSRVGFSGKNAAPVVSFASGVDGPPPIPKLIANSNLRGMNRVGGKILGLNEGTSGVSYTLFLQHLLTVWSPKAVLSRSIPELFEISFLEIFEMSLVYFGIPLTAKRFFFPLANRLHKDIPSDQLTKSLGQLKKEGISPEKLAKIRSIKGAAALMAMISGSAAIEYALTFAKNLVTLKAFKKDKFSHIASLSSQGKTDTSSDNPIHKKAVHRIKAAMGVAIGAVGVGLLMAKHGHKSAGLQKFLDWFLHPGKTNGDFKYEINTEKMSANIKDRIKKGMATPWRFIKVGMSEAMNSCFMAVAFVAYMDACRDKLERWEVLPRLAVVMSYLAFGSATVAKLAKAPFMKRFPDLFKTTVDEYTGKKSVAVSKLSDIYQDAYAKAKNAAPKAGHGVWHEAAQKHFASRLPAKIKIFAIPELFGAGFVMAINSFLTRVWTPRVYKHFETQKAQAVEPTGTATITMPASAQQVAATVSAPNPEALPVIKPHAPIRRPEARLSLVSSSTPLPKEAVAATAAALSQGDHRASWIAKFSQQAPSVMA